ncbi:flagellar basal-body rod protein FlgG [Peribacillus deserti]|uniref:Flagellar basal-body rod protein FlgG n=1 Tax=Peribacillus deserti TaxID=673318 RepID=A0ABS2QC27_9BACI|nr:flagellar hook-basal body protein [Peribacillus deserti]MBM7690710.1 flagellar basal-body rod protein FlgG [Peribacillus deserti]
MNRVMFTATNTLSQLQKKMDIISNNLGNIETTGYKRKETYFNDLLAQEFKNQGRDDKEKGRLTPIGIRMGTGAKISQSRLVLTQGSLKTTDRNLDAALTKNDQFFKIRGDQNTVQFTRDGAFYLSPTDASGNSMALVTGNGQAVLDEFDRPIVIGGEINNISFTENGQLRAATENRGVQTFELGIISVKKPQFLEQKGTNLYALPQGLNTLGVTEEEVFTRLEGGLRGEISMQQGVLENSNVELSKEMTDLMNVQRSYQFQARTITMADQMAGLVNGIR